MNKEQFKKYWNDTYPESLPIGHRLRSVYHDRWLRIHSLPNSKRYAENEADYKIILDRQNELISNIFGNNLDFFTLIGLYTHDLMNSNYEDLDYKNEYTHVNMVDLHAILPHEYENGMYYDIYIKNAAWAPAVFDNVLKKIADDEIRALFVNPQAQCIIMPYDGGVDIILKDTKTRDTYKNQFAQWLSTRKDGL